MVSDDLVEALTQHGTWLCEHFPGKRQHAYGERLLELATEVAGVSGGALPADLRSRLRS